MKFEEYLSQHHTVQTTKSYQRVVEKLLFHHPDLNRMKYRDMLMLMNENNLKSAVQLAAIKKYFDFLVCSNIRNDHPCKQMSVRRERKAIQFQDLFSAEELELLLKRESRYQMLELRNKCLISLMVYQGLKPANIEQLKLNDVNLENGTIYIRITTCTARRIMNLNPLQLTLFHEYFATERCKVLRKSTEKLFVNKTGRATNVDSINRMLRPLKALFPERNLNAGTIRQSVISNWINVSKLRIEDAQILSGQKWLSSTERYRRRNMEEFVKMINIYFPNFD